MNMRNVTCVDTKTTKVSTRVTLWFIFYSVGPCVMNVQRLLERVSREHYLSFYDSYGKFNPILLKDSQLNRTISGRNLSVGFYK